MEQLIAKLYFTKEVEEDNYFDGTMGNRSLVMVDHLEFTFTDKQDLVNQLANWMSSHFDIREDQAIKGTLYDEVSEVFCYAQNEDEHGNQISLTEACPDGYYADYIFDVKVFAFREVQYKF